MRHISDFIKFEFIVEILPALVSTTLLLNTIIRFGSGTGGQLTPLINFPIIVGISFPIAIANLQKTGKPNLKKSIGFGIVIYLIMLLFAIFIQTGFDYIDKEFFPRPFQYEYQSVPYLPPISDYQKILSVLNDIVLIFLFTILPIWIVKRKTKTVKFQFGKKLFLYMILLSIAYLVVLFSVLGTLVTPGGPITTYDLVSQLKIPVTFSWLVLIIPFWFIVDCIVIHRLIKRYKYWIPF